MLCPTCQTVVPDGSGFCPACGAALRDMTSMDEIQGEIEVVEVTAEIMPETPAAEAGAGAAPMGDGITTALTLRGPAGEAAPAVVRARELALAAWRQPAVRAAVKTGASAVALSLAMRAARQALASPRPRRTVTRSVLPTLTDLFQPEAQGSANEGEYEVVETIFYMRRVVRRH